MELIEEKQNKSNSNIIILQKCRSSDSESSESDKNKSKKKFKLDSSFDSENYKDSSLEDSIFSDEKLNDNPNNSGKKQKKLSLILENKNDEHSSSSIMERNEIKSKINFIDLMKSPQQNIEKSTGYVSSNVIFSPLFLNNFKKDKRIQGISYNDKKMIFENKISLKKRNELEIDDGSIRFINNKCICSSSSCKIF